MPRHMAGATEAPAFRAVITKTYPKGRWGTDTEEFVQKIVYGPYATPGAAKAMITREIRQEERYGRYNPRRADAAKVEGHVEVSATRWERVDA